MTVIYLVGSNTLAALEAAGLKGNAAKDMAKKVIAQWAKTGKRPKIADLAVDDENVEKALKSASLAEAFGVSKKRTALVELSPALLNRMIKDINSSC